MIHLCTDSGSIKSLLDYMGESYIAEPYLYVNLKKYGCENPSVLVWVDKDQEAVCGIYLLYFDCLHFFTNEPDYPVERLAEMIKKLNPKVVMTHGKTGENLSEVLSCEVKIEKNYVMDWRPIKERRKSNRVHVAEKEELKEIADLIMADKEFQLVYQKDILIKQLEERFDDGFSRYFIICEEEKIVAAYSTYGEADGFAMLGGLIVHPDYRHRGLASELIRHISEVLCRENKQGICLVIYNNLASLNLHKQMGAISLGALFKYILH